MWSYKPSNWAMMDPNERCAPPLPTLGGLRQRWCHNCSEKVSKIANSASPDNAIIMQGSSMSSYQGL